MTRVSSVTEVKPGPHTAPLTGCNCLQSLQVLILSCIILTEDNSQYTYKLKCNLSLLSAESTWSLISLSVKFKAVALHVKLPSSVRLSGGNGQPFGNSYNS